MSIDFIKRFKDDRKYISIVLFILFMLIVSGLVTPVLVSNKKAGWNQKLGDKIVEIESGTNSIFLGKERALLSLSSSLTDKLVATLSHSKTTYGSLIRLINHEEYSNYSIEVLAPNGKLIAWNRDPAVKQIDILPLTFPAGEVHFYNSDLVTYLTVTDTFLIDNDQFYSVISTPIEKQYTLLNPFYRSINFSNELSQKLAVNFKVDYSPFSEHSRDGREYSFDLLNNNDNKIGTVTFTKPSLDYFLNDIQSKATAVQSTLIFLAMLFFGLSLSREFNLLKYRTVKLILFIAYSIAFRVVLYKIEFPSSFISGSLTDPSYFSSSFGYGIVRSPVELFVTTIFLLFIALFSFRYAYSYFLNSNRTKFTYLRLILIPPLVIIFFLILRGFNASVRSLIFDSTLRYFKSTDLLPGLPALVMNLNSLLFGLTIILVLSAIILVIFILLQVNRKVVTKKLFLFVFFAFEVMGIISLLAQNTPLITPIISLILVLLLFLIIYYLLFKKVETIIYFYAFATLAASIFAITLQNYFNLELERESLKTTALEINRSSDNLLKFFLTETLTKAATDRDLISSYSIHNYNYNSEAFKLWSESSLQKESLNSAVIILNKFLKPIGGFSVGIEEDFKLYTNLKRELKQGIGIIKSSIQNNNNENILAGIIEVKDRGITLGYLIALINVDILGNYTQSIPEFLDSKKNILNSVINPEQLKIFEFTDSKLQKVYGDIYPSLDQTKPIVNAVYTSDNEAWLNIPLSGENYLTYALKNGSENSTNIISVSVLEKNLSWNLYNFFKIFIIHSAFIILLFFIIIIYQYKTLRYTFQSQLLIAFLFVSIIPVIILAIYNRQVVKEKSNNAILKELSERSDYVENYIHVQLKNDLTNDLNKVFENAGKELGISFSIYDGTTQIFNSKDQYYRAGLFNDRINPEAFYQLTYLNYREYLSRESIDNYYYNSFYKKTEIEGKKFIISVNDAFNKVNIIFSVIDVDVFLFGIYSFASILIIIFSTILANKISSPIRRLTKATDSIAHGDFDVEINNDQKGELRDLLDGFKSMTNELQRNQAEMAEMERENAWKEMAKQVAHEIKNPLTPMKLAVQQLIVSYKDKNKNFDKIFSKVSTTLLNQIESLSQIATEFSRFARMPKYKIERIDLMPVINDIINLFVEENIKIIFDTGISYALIEGDIVQLRRLLINLIRNSIQAQASTLHISTKINQNKFELYLSDNGKGIPAEFKDRIFESNFTTKEKGMGLGLKLAKRFLESINGQISLKSSSESGTVFEISIPVIQHNIVSN